MDDSVRADDCTGYTGHIIDRSAALRKHLIRTSSAKQNVEKMLQTVDILK